MTKENTSINFDQALDLLSTYTKEIFINNVWVPSIREYISVNELTSKQQKNLLSAAIDSNAEGYKPFFTKIFYQILLENCQTTKEVVDNFTYYDRLAIAIAMRKHISKELNVEFSADKSEVVDLSDLVENLKNFKHPSLTTLKIEKNGVSILIQVEVPTIKKEVEYFDNIPSLKKESTSEILKQAISEAYVAEVSKYIKEIEIQGVNLSFNDLKTKQKILVLEKLPSTILQTVLKEISAWKEDLNEFFTVESTSGDKKLIDIDTTLFLSA
jgi:hypothetical protein